MLDLLDRHNGACDWAAPIISAIEATGSGKALDWAIALIRPELDRLEPEHKHKLDRFVAELVNLKDQTVDSAIVRKRAKEIWHTPGRDSLQTAIERLHEALGMLLENEPLGYCKAISRAIRLLASDSHGNPLADKVEWIIRSYQQWKEGTQQR